MFLRLPPKYPTLTPLLSLVDGLAVLHALISGACPTTTRVLTNSWADECGTLWRERSVGFGSQAEERRSQMTVACGVLVKVVLVILLGAVKIL